MAKSKFPTKIVLAIVITAISVALMMFFLLTIAIGILQANPQLPEEFEIPVVNTELLEEVDDILFSDDSFSPRLDEIEDLLEIEPISNQTEFSEDNPLTQIGDITENPILPQTTTLSLVSRTIQIASDGERTESITNFDIPTFAFLVEDISDKDFRTGFLETELFLIGEPNTRYMGTGKVDYLVNNESIFQNPIEITVNGVSNAEGMIDVMFLSPTGIPSDIFTFDFNAHFNRFVNENISPVEITLVEFTITDDKATKFSLLGKRLYRMDVARDDIQILIVNEQGGTERVYPTDSRIKIQSNALPVFFKSCITPPDDPDTCFNYITQRTYSGNLLQIGTAPAPQILGLNLIDQNGAIIASSGGGTGIVLDELVTRNANYTVTVNSPRMQFDLSLAKAQQTFLFTCTATVDVTFEFIIGTATNGLPIGIRSASNADFTVIGSTCNFPK